MYAKLFTSIYQGTLRGNSHGLLVFTNLLAHADKDGCVDIHPKAVAEEVGLSIEQVKTALLMLESPDDESRSPEEQGRRIKRMDDHRAWGWEIVNYVKYRAIRNEDDRREQNRQSQERWRQRNKPASAGVSQGKPQSAHTEADTEAEAKKRSSTAAQAQTLPAFTGDPNIQDFNAKQRPALAHEWELPEEWGNDAVRLGWKVNQILKESEKYRQYWTTGKGAGTRRTIKGWRQSWSNWLSKAERYAA